MAIEQLHSYRDRKCAHIHQGGQRGKRSGEIFVQKFLKMMFNLEYYTAGSQILAKQMDNELRGNEVRVLGRDIRLTTPVYS